MRVPLLLLGAVVSTRANYTARPAEIAQTRELLSLGPHHGDLFPSCEVSHMLHKPQAPGARVPGLFAVARERMRTRHLSLRTEQAYLQWMRRYVAFHRGRAPRDLGAHELEQFLTDLAVNRRVSAATQNQALQALLFLYRHVLQL